MRRKHAGRIALPCGGAKKCVWNSYTQDTLDTRLGVVKELAVGRFVVEIDGDGAVCAGRFDGLSHVSSPCRWLSVAMRHREGKALKDQAFGEKIGASPLNAMECGGDNRFEHMSLCVNE